MIGYINSKMVLADVPPDQKAWSGATQAASDLFVVSEDASSRVDETRAQAHHRLITRQLFLSQQARPDLRRAIFSLGRRVTKEYIKRLQKEEKESWK
jgi:hypothetical protein